MKGGKIYAVKSCEKSLVKVIRSGTMVPAPKLVKFSNFDEKWLVLVENIQDTLLKLLKMTLHVNKSTRKV